MWTLDQIELNSNIVPTMATHFPSLSRNQDNNQYAQMFVQDLQLAAMPNRSNFTRYPDFNIQFEGEDGECKKAEQIVAEIGRSGDRHDSTVKVCEAVQKVIRQFASEGCAVFEIIYDDYGSKHASDFTSKRLWRLPGFYFRIIPHGDWNYWNKKIEVIPADKIWHLKMPSELGGMRGYRKVLRQLGKFDSINPNFLRQDLPQNLQHKFLDYQRYRRNVSIYDHKITRSWGWNLRDSSAEWKTEFFYCYRMVNHAWAKTILREHIISEFNQFFHRLDFKCKIKVNGLPNATDIDRARAELLAGKISFQEVLDLVWF